MADRTLHVHPWRYWLLFSALAAAVHFVKLLPLDMTPANIPGPDLLLCLVFAWVLRRPDYMPALLIAGVFLVEDLLLLRPPGLHALLVLLGAEFLRHRQPLMRELGFPVEWMMVSAVMLVLLISERMALAVAMVPSPPVGMGFMQLLMTVIAYPFVVFASHYAAKVRKPATGEVDALGRPL